MGDWTDRERAILADVFSKVDYDAVGADGLQRCLIVYPWTMRYFASFGNLYNAEAIKANAKVAHHGSVVMHGLDRGLKDLDHMKDTYADLGKKHSEELKIDPDNFRLLSDTLTIAVAARMGSKFTSEIQAALQKFLSAVVFSLGRQYH